MTMAAALFPAAIKETARSMANLNGPVLCENGLAAATVWLHPDDISSEELAVLADEVNVSHVPLVYQHCPEGQTRRGFVVLGRLLDATNAAKGQQLVVVSYVKTRGANTVAALEVTGSITHVAADDPSTFTVDAGVTNRNQLRVGSPLINRGTGQFAHIVAAGPEDDNAPDGTWVAILDRQLPDESDVSTYIVVEQEGATPLTLRDSPAVTTISRRVQLQP